MPDEDFEPLLQYLQESKKPPGNQWVHLKVRGVYRDQVGIVAENGTILSKCVTKKLPGNPPVLIIPVHTDDADVEHAESLYTFTLKKGSFEIFDPVNDQKFINSVSWLLVSTIARNAWYMVWCRSWPDGCVAELKDTLRRSAITCTDIEDVYLFEGVPVPSTMLSRVYSAGDELVVIFGSFAGQVVRVVEQVDEGDLITLLLEHQGTEDRFGVPVPNSLALENSLNSSRSEQQVTHQCIHCTHTLDYSLYSHLSLTRSPNIPIRRPKTISRRHHLVDPQQEQTLPGTANLIG